MDFKRSKEQRLGCNKVLSHLACSHSYMQPAIRSECKPLVVNLRKTISEFLWRMKKGFLFLLLFPASGCWMKHKISEWFVVAPFPCWPPTFPAESAPLWFPWHTPGKPGGTGAGSAFPSGESESRTAPN